MEAGHDRVIVFYYRVSPFTGELGYQQAGVIAAKGRSAGIPAPTGTLPFRALCAA
jgi:hypothetical protein